MNTWLKYTAGVGGVVALSAAARHYGGRTQLTSEPKQDPYSKALQCMKEHQLAIAISGSIDATLNPRLNFTVVKFSTDKPEVVGAVCFIYMNYINKPPEWAIEVYDNGKIDLSSIGQYLANSNASSRDTIRRSVEQLPVMIPREEDDKSGYYSTNLFHNWQRNNAVVKRQ
jgi:hypothetical protein